MFKENFGSTYRRLADEKSVTVKDLGKAKIAFFATHEMCLITYKSLYYPFSSTSNTKNTFVCGPLRERWQVDELETLRDRGWTVHYYAAAGRLLDATSNKLEAEKLLGNDYHDRPFLEKCTVIEFNAEEEDDVVEDDEDALISTYTTLSVKDDAGIEVDLLALCF